MTQHEARENWVKLCKEYQGRLDSYPKKSVDGEELRDIPANDLEGLEKMRADINEAKSVLDKLSVVADLDTDYLATHSTPKSDENLLVKGIMSMHNAWQKGQKTATTELDWDYLVKTTMSTGAGFAPQSIRTGEIVPAIHRPTQFWNRINVIPTDQASIVFMEQTTRTINAGEIAEAGDLDTANESAFVYTERTEPIRRVGHVLPVTREQFEDAAEMRVIIENDMMQGLMQKLEVQWLRGDGASPNLSGVIDTSNRTRVQSQSASSLDYTEVFAEAAAKVQITGRANPDLLLIPGLVYWKVAQERTSDGVYLHADPRERANLRFWGMEVVATEAFANNTPGSANGLVIDRQMIRARVRRDVELAMSESHDDRFAKDIFTLRAQARIGVQLLRPEAACLITSL
jgi:HK97 family phage major capsid protein